MPGVAVGCAFRDNPIWLAPPPVLWVHFNFGLF
jgi:hypothetical protein